MIAAMDAVGNPSSVHAEGRAAKSLIETARGQIAEAFGASGSEVVFLSGATEAASLALSGKDLTCAPIEHDCVLAWCNAGLTVGSDGQVEPETPSATALQAANSETGVLQSLPEGLFFCDAVQAVGKTAFAFEWSKAQMAAVSAHKIGGAKGVGCLILKQGLEIAPHIKGGGQEMGRRSGTENVVGIAGFGAAAVAAHNDLANGEWARVEEIRDALEEMVLDAAPEAIVFGKDAPRLPNTSNFAVPGWKSETQVMQMDLAGFAVSSGTACSSGKVKTSAVLTAMGVDDLTASSAIRISMGPTTTQAEVTAFADTWIDHYRRFRARAA